MVLSTKNLAEINHFVVAPLVCTFVLNEIAILLNLFLIPEGFHVYRK
jgi:hypothetical protein